tara:strand:+ start:269 stop:430 length:162 start_codon:yes stop_codon:yes gene_type:complete
MDSKRVSDMLECSPGLCIQGFNGFYFKDTLNDWSSKVMPLLLLTPLSTGNKRV